MTVHNIERTSLEAHVDLCAERYENMQGKIETMETRLQKVETIVSEIKTLLIEKETLAYKKLVGLGIGIIGSLLTALLGLIIYIVTHQTLATSIAATVKSTIN
jgi:hypothetical protein